MIIAVLGCSVMSNSLRPWTIAHQLPLSMGLSRQGYWSGLPFPTSGDLPDPEIEPASFASPALAGGFFTTSTPRVFLRLGESPWTEKPGGL